MPDTLSWDDLEGTFEEQEKEEREAARRYWRIDLRFRFLQVTHRLSLVSRTTTLNAMSISDRLK